MENGHTLEQMIIDRLKQLEDKIDKVRAEDLPAMKVDVALLIKDNSTSSKLHSGLAGVLAVVVSSLIEKIRH